MRVHRGIIPALQHASTWGALSGLFATVATQLPAPYQMPAVLGGGLCGVIGILLRSPDMDKDDLKDSDANSNR